MYTPYIMMRSPLSFPILSTLLVSLALTCTSVWAFAQEQARVHVDVIIASDDGEGIDDALEPHAKTLQEQFPQFSHFTLQHSDDIALQEGQSQEIDLPREENATITLIEVDGPHYTLHLKVPGGQTTIKSRAKGKVFIGGPKALNGTLLLLLEVK